MPKSTGSAKWFVARSKKHRLQVGFKPNKPKVLVAGAVLAGVVIFIGLSISWFIVPRQDDVGSPDALVVLGGGRGERLEYATELARANPDAELVLSIGSIKWRGQAELLELCDQTTEGGSRITCFVADPDSTKGEAATVGQIAAERGWKEVTVVTSSYHVHRTRIQFRRCVDAVVNVVGAPARPALKWLVVEWGGTLGAAFNRGCTSAD